MKSKWIRENLGIILIACVMWSFFVMLSIRANAQTTGPFCSACSLVTVEHMTSSEYMAYAAGIDAQLSGIISSLQYLSSSAQNSVLSLEALYTTVSDLAGREVIGWETAMDMYTQLDTLSALVYTEQYINDMKSAVYTVQASLYAVSFTASEFCISCTATGDGTGTGEGDCCCNCPDYGPILEEMSDRIASQTQAILDTKNYIFSIKNTLDTWFVKWQAQDDKLQPLIDELKPMLPNIKKFYDDYYSADWGTATWSNIKNIVSDLTEKEIVKKWDRYYGDYFDSTMSSASWSSFGYAMGAAERVYKADTADGKTGEQTMISVLKDWQESTKHPISESYTLPSEVPDEKEYVTLNWFQRITAALGVIAFSPTNISNQVDLDFDEHEEEAKRVENAVVSLGTEVSSKFGSLYGSYKNIFDSFKNLVPRDTLPTSIRLHPGFKFDYNPAGSSGGDQSAYVLPPWDWAVQEHAIFKIALDMIRGIFGFIWWVLGFGIVYEIVVGVYGFCVSITQKAMAVFGSLGRSGGGSE